MFINDVGFIQDVYQILWICGDLWFFVVYDLVYELDEWVFVFFFEDQVGVGGFDVEVDYIGYFFFFCQVVFVKVGRRYLFFYEYSRLQYLFLRCCV